MLPRNRAIVLLTATLLITPIFSATPASAEQKFYRRGVAPRREVNYREKRPVIVYQRVVRLSNGDFRLPHGEVVPNRQIVRLRNQGYFRLPNGDIVVPTQEIIPSRSVVRISRDTFRLPNGTIVKI